MKQIFFPCILQFAICIVSFSQNVGINANGTLPDPSAMLDVVAANKGLLIPRVNLSSTTDAATIPSPATSLIVYNSNAGMTGGGIGFWYWNGTQWVQLAVGGGGANSWLLIGNSGTVDGTNFIGTTDNIPFNIRVNNQKAGRIDHLQFNTFFGYQAGIANTIGIKNTAIGYGADVASGSLQNATAVGYNAIVGASNALVLGGTGVNAVNVGIGTATPSAAAKLDITSTNSGLLIPRVSLLSTTDAVTIPTPVTSVLVYNTNAAMVGGSLGYWYWDGVKWVQLVTSVGASNAWLLLGNTGTVDGTNFIGTSDNVPFNIRVNNQRSGRVDHILFNTFWGYQSGNSNTTGNYNTASGYRSLYSNTSGYENSAYGANALNGNSTGFNNTAVGDSALYSNTSGYQNTATGNGALSANTTGTKNTAVGNVALSSNSTGGSNTAVGTDALNRNSTGSNNTALGAEALQKNTTGYQNTGIGNTSLLSNTTGSANTACGNGSLTANTTGNNSTAVGYWALLSNTTGNNNTAIGSSALHTNTTGFMNTATGYNALRFNVTGDYNTAQGSYALRNNTSGHANVAMGARALYSNTNRSYIVAVGDSSLYYNGVGVSSSLEATANTALGSKALHLNNTGYQNTASGYLALYSNTTGSENTAIGYKAGTDGAAHTQCTFIGSNTSLTTTRTNATLLGAGIVDAQCTGDNQVLLGNTAVTELRAAVTGITAYSDARYKTNIEENVAGLNFILKLKPVTYNVVPRELYRIWGTADSIMDKVDFSGAQSQLRIGFLAQEVESAARQCGFNFPGIDVPNNEQEVYSLRYVDFIMPLVKAVQELSKENQNLKQTIENQSLKIEKLHNDLASERIENDSFIAKMAALSSRIEKVENLVNPPPAGLSRSANGF